MQNVLIIDSELSNQTEFSTGCTFISGNDPCPTCPRKITMLYMCGILQDELSQIQQELNYED